MLYCKICHAKPVSFYKASGARKNTPRKKESPSGKKPWKIDPRKIALGKIASGKNAPQQIVFLVFCCS